MAADEFGCRVGDDVGTVFERPTQVGSGERVEKIRTYNFPQGRVSDHRIGLTIYQLEDVLQGGLDVILEPVIASRQVESPCGETRTGKQDHRY